MINEFISMDWLRRCFPRGYAKETPKPVVRAENVVDKTSEVYEGKVVGETKNYLEIKFNRRYGFKISGEEDVHSIGGLRATRAELVSCRHENGVYFFDREFLKGFVGRYYLRRKSDDEIIELLEKDQVSPGAKVR